MVFPFSIGRNKRKIIFVHINKTGGVSIEQALGFSEKQHKTALEFKEQLGQKRWDKAYKFSIIRNPWDKVVSQYFHRIKTNQTGLVSNPIEFKKWVKLTYGEQNPKYYDDPKYFMPHLNWLTDEKGEVIVDFIGRFENLDNDFQHICERTSVKAELHFMNKSEHREYQYYYDSETREIVGKWFKKDIEIFKYTF